MNIKDILWPFGNTDAPRCPPPPEKFQYPVWVKEERTSSYYGYGHSEITTKDSYRKAYASKQSVALADGRTLYEVKDGNSVLWVDSLSLTWPKYEKA